MVLSTAQNLAEQAALFNDNLSALVLYVMIGRAYAFIEILH
jgi:hypothetical protein